MRRLRTKQLVAELAELIAIPSVSADPAHAATSTGRRVGRRADRGAGGTVEIVERDGRPLVVGEVRPRRRRRAGRARLRAPRRPAARPARALGVRPWTLVERNGWLVARGVADDKAHLFMLLEATELLAAAGELPVTVRFAIDAEEEVGGRLGRRLGREADRGPADVALILDGGYATETLPSFCTALRGICYFHVTVRTGERDLHSGMFGGAALTATHALMQVALGGAPRAGRPAARAAARGDRRRRPSARSTAGAACPSGADGARGATARARATRARRRSSGCGRPPSRRSRVNGVEGGSPRLMKTVLPVEAHANVSIRLAPGQTTAAIAPVVRAAAARGGARRARPWTSSSGRRASPASSTPTRARSCWRRTRSSRSSASGPCSSARAARSPSSRHRGARDPDRRDGVRAADRADALAERAHPGSALREGVETIVEVLRRFGRAWLTPATRAPSRRSSPRRCSSASSATSRSTRRSDPSSTTYPSTAKQLDLSRLLVDELRAIGLADVELTEPGYVFATLPGTVADTPTVGLIAHVDTSPAASGTGVVADRAPRPGRASRSSFPATRPRCSIPTTCRSSRSGSATTS